MKQVQTNSLRAFGGRLIQGIDGKSGMRRVWLKCQHRHVFMYPYAQEWLLKDKMSLKEPILWIWRLVEAGNQWKVGYEGVWLRVSVALGFCISVGLENMMEI